MTIPHAPVHNNADYIREAQILDEAAGRNLEAAQLDNPEQAELLELHKLKKLRFDIENMIKGLNTQ
jgi:hypothetical protein